MPARVTVPGLGTAEKAEKAALGVPLPPPPPLQPTRNSAAGTNKRFAFFILIAGGPHFNHMLTLVVYKPWTVKPRLIERGLEGYTHTGLRMAPLFENETRILAVNVRRLRLARGVSQEKFAALAGIDRTYASKIERGVGNPSLGILCSICRALECEIVDLFRV